MTFTAFGPIYKATAALLPKSMDTIQAWAILYAIASQESRLDERIQIGGPAHGFWQFELGGGVTGVLNHSVTKPLIRGVLDRLDYGYAPESSYVAIVHNDVLAFAYARLLLYTVPEALPTQDQRDEGWRQYLSAWRPGAPHRGTWDALYDKAWLVALGVKDGFAG